MPQLIRLYIRQIMIGFSLSAGFVALLLYSNVANLWHLISSSSMGILACLMLFIFNGIVFSGVQFGIAIMRLADDPDDGGKRQSEPVAALDALAVVVPVSEKR